MYFTKMPAADATTAITSTENSSKTTVTLLHFNDCYNIEPRAIEPAGGAARFKTALESYAHCNPLVLFSGDILGPSLSKYFIFYDIYFVYYNFYLDQ